VLQISEASSGLVCINSALIVSRLVLYPVV